MGIPRVVAGFSRSKFGLGNRSLVWDAYANPAPRLETPHFFGELAVVQRLQRWGSCRRQTQGALTLFATLGYVV